MLKFFIVGTLAVVAVIVALAASLGGWAWWVLLVLVVALLGLGIWDVRPAQALDPAQLPGARAPAVPAWRTSGPSCSSTSSSATTTAGPYDRDTRSLDLRAGQGHQGRAGLRHRARRQRARLRVPACTRPRPVDPPEEPPRVRIGGPDCTQPYDMALLNVSAMSFGALSGQRDRARSTRARPAGGFAHDTGEGGLTHVPPASGGDLVWEIGSGLLRRAHQGRRLRPRASSRDKAAHDAGQDASRSSSARAPSPASAACCRRPR